MAISINWATFVITVPKADMLLIQSNPTEIRQLDLDDFRKELKGLEDNEPGMVAPKTHNHNPPITVGGVTLARSVEILAPYTVTFEDGQYAVNLVGANSNVGDRTNVNQVSVRSANSAGLTDISSIQAASFQGYVSVDTASNYSGTTFPVGIRNYPVNNLADALLIANKYSLAAINLLTSTTITGIDASAGYLFTSDNPVTVTATLDPSADLSNCLFTNLTVQGTLDGDSTIRQCNLLNVNYFNGTITECSLDGTITLGGGGEAGLYDCWSGVPGGGAGQTPTIDMGGSGQQLLMRNYAGGIKLVNGTGADAHSIDMNSGRVILDPTITAGTYTVRGVADIQDNSGGTTTVDDQTINAEVTLTRKLVDADRVLVDGQTGNMQWIDADDGVTVLRTKNVRSKSGGAITMPDDAPAEERRQ